MTGFRELSCQLWDGIVFFQRKQRMSATLLGATPESAGATLSFGEGLTLHLLSAQRECNVRDLAQTLGLERSWVSRIISGLEEKGALESRPDEADKRQKIVKVTKQGLATLRKLNKERRVLLEKILVALNAKEQKEFAKLIHILASAFGVPDNRPVLDPHPVDFELARLSCAVGVAGNSFMGTGVNVTQYHVLMILFGRGNAYTLTELHAKLPIDMSSLSRTIESFVKKKIIKKSKSEKDGRSYLVSLTSSGEKYYESVRAIAYDRMYEAIQTLDKKDVARLTVLFGYASKDIPERDVQYSKPKLQLSLVRGSEQDDVQKVQKALKDLSGSQGNVTMYTVKDENRTIGAIQVVSSSKTGELQRVSFNVANLPAQDCVELLRNAVKATNLP